MLLRGAILVYRSLLGAIPDLRISIYCRERSLNNMNDVSADAYFLGCLVVGLISRLPNGSLDGGCKNLRVRAPFTSLVGRQFGSRRAGEFYCRIDPADISLQRGCREKK